MSIINSCSSSVIKEYLLRNIIYTVEELEDDQSLIDSGLIDSISLIKVILFVESKFGIKLKEDDLEPDNFETINNIMELIKNKDTIK